MAATGNGTTSWLGTFPSTITPLTSAYSWSFWYFPLSAPANSTPNQRPFGLMNTGGGTPVLYDIGFAWNHSVSTTWKSLVHREAGGTFKLAQLPFTPAHGEWIHVAGTYDGTTARLYYNGVLANSVAAANLSGTAGNPNISISSWDDGASDFDPSPVAEAAIWSVCLSADEILALSRGTAVSSIQFGSVVFYNPLSSTTSTVGPNLTNHNSVTFNTTYFQDMSGGVAAGGDAFVVATTYGHVMDGGVAVGGDAMLATASYFVDMSGGVAVGGDGTLAITQYGHTMSGGVAIGGNGTITGSHYHFTMTGGVAVGGKRGFPVVQPVGSGAIIIASGREFAFTTK